ncbi:MAG: helix-turn-helix transcriptional regulator [Firmicutes bacterium]|jgi:transcriptional regulator with XRE-family HTH domain|nr:helix-turn-helix transcriptional regulator [Bacillota bacterium]
MDLQYIRERISVLRTKKNVSEYRMSTDLGHSKSYIQSISSGRSMPSLGEFLYICEYLGVTPKEFFDEDMKEPQLVQRLCELTRNMSEADLNVLISTAERLNDK